MSPEPGTKANRQWSQVGWILTHHRDGLLTSSFCLILDSSVGLWVGIQSAGNLVSQTSRLRILYSADEDNLSPFDSKIACRCQSIKLNNIHVYASWIKCVCSCNIYWPPLCGCLVFLCKQNTQIGSTTSYAIKLAYNELVDTPRDVPQARSALATRGCVYASRVVSKLLLVMSTREFWTLCSNFTKYLSFRKTYPMKCLPCCHWGSYPYKFHISEHRWCMGIRQIGRGQMARKLITQDDLITQLELLLWLCKN